MKPMKKKDQVYAFVLLKMVKKILTEEIWRQNVEQRLKEMPPGDPSHIELPNLAAIEDAGKCFLMEACYGCLLRGSA